MNPTPILEAILRDSPRGPSVYISEIIEGRFAFVTEYRRIDQQMALVPDNILTLLRVRQRLGEFEPRVIYHQDGEVLG